MKNHRPLAWIVLPLVAALTGPPALAAEGVSGIVKSVDLDAKKVVVTPTGQDKTVDVTVTDKTVMKTEAGESYALRSLKAGDGIGIALNGGVALSVQVAVKPEELVGHVKSVAADLKTFVVTLLGGSIDATVAVNAETSIISVDGRKIELKELKKGDGVGIAHDSRSLASKIVVNAKPVEKPAP